ncbi:putative u4 tri-snrnp-associated protein 3-like protein [Eutypa lata UCREL1]|uniref:Putative u4 tri-snrnp-associated protein 3-like protein n=1 Tax=Eutypa lata (strain UCR-EL1) TaxID=1287681 RepID=M7T7A6_EUTLA|nr:putative u4 tri-snrnp-associated protein 3-like protein [Eutypa lata UCREL1]
MDPVRAIGETTATHTEKTVPETKTVDTALDHDRPGEIGATDIDRDLHDDGGGDSRRRRDDRSKSYDAAKDSPRPEERNRATSQDHAMDVDDGGDREEEDDEEDDDVEVADDGLAAMQAMMGFGGFGTTKGAHVAGNNVGAVRKEKKIEYRQYMNRVGGFNRPLSPGR